MILIDVVKFGIRPFTIGICGNKKNYQRKLVVIGSDITKGIVPVEKENRLWRDVTGWAYQDLAAQADKIDIIWYGCNQTIKQTEEWNR